MPGNEQLKYETERGTGVWLQRQYIVTPVREERKEKSRW